MTGSIQEAREAIGTHRGALAQVDGEFFANVAKRYDAIKAKGSDAHPADYRRLTGEIGAWMNKLASKGNLSKVEDSAFDGASAWASLVNHELRLNDDYRAAFGDTPRTEQGGWINAETGKPVRVFAPNEPVYDGLRQPDAPKASVGAMLAALLGGANTPEIKAALSEGSDSAGGYSIPQHVLKEFFDKLRAKTQFVQAGAKTVVLDGMKTRILRVASDPAATWRAENGAVGESEPTFEAVDFLPKSLATLVKVPLELLQDSVNVEEALTAALIGALSVELDRAALFGSGTGNEPRGLFNVAGVNSVSMGANGATPSSYDELIDAMYELEVDNAGPPTAAIMHPRTGRTLRKLKDTTGQPLRLPPALEGLPFLPTTSVPINQTQGTAANVCSTTLVGDFSQAMLGLRQELRIQRLDQTFAGNLQVGFVAHLRADVAFAHPESFCRIIGIKA